jgi:hypothetical protein
LCCEGYWTVCRTEPRCMTTVTLNSDNTAWFDPEHARTHVTSAIVMISLVTLINITQVRGLTVQ